MFVGHGFLAFALAAGVAAQRGWGRDRVLAVGLLAGLFGTLPDVDMLYALAGLAGGPGGLVAASDAFWAAAGEVHRAVTHSLLVGVVGAIGFACWRGRADPRTAVVGVVALSALVAVGAASGPVTAAVLGAFVLGGIGVGSLGRRLGVGPRPLFAAALAGLLTHPFGDLLTGQPPALLYPLDIAVFGGRVTLSADPTLHLLGAFFVELAAIWFGVAVLVSILGSDLRSTVRPRAALGVGYAAAVFAVPAPTLELASPFVFSVLAVGVVGVPLRVRTADRPGTGRRVLAAVVTALTAVTLAGLAYAAAYIAVAA
jgi:membrane-bound metal-dependent hydrolase YbcI (DUF457 family)